jgi:GTP-binding protein
MDLRHEAKRRDRDLLMWLRQKQIRTLAVYTKADKLSGNSRSKQARQLDSGHGISADDRIVFSSVNRQGRDALIERLQTILTGA